MTVKSAPAFSRSGKCPPFILALKNINMLNAMVLKPYVNKPANVTPNKSKPGFIGYVLNPDDGQFLQICGESEKSIINFRFQVRRKNEKHYTTLVFVGEVRNAKSFSEKNNLLFIK